MTSDDDGYVSAGLLWNAFGMRQPAHRIKFSIASRCCLLLIRVELRSKGILETVTASRWSLTPQCSNPCVLLWLVDKPGLSVSLEVNSSDDVEKV